MKPLLIVRTGMAMLALALPAAGQTSKQPGTQQPASPCQATPDQPQTKNGAKNGDNRKAAGKDSLTETLTPCGGVLEPPPTGDEDLTEPAPDQGKTPVIKPGEVPPQPPKGN